MKPLKVLLLAPANVIHTQRWASGLADRGLQVILASQHPLPADSPWQPPSGVRLVQLPFEGRSGYFSNAWAVKRLATCEKPDLLHAHYASGYGTLALLTGFHPWLLSVWGSDIYEFPHRGPFHRKWLCAVLCGADAIASTSQAMASEVMRLAPRVAAPAITPFGVDSHVFAPRPQSHEGVVIGTVKKLEPQYGIDILLKAFALLCERGQPSHPSPQAPLSLTIMGSGPQLPTLKLLARELGIENLVTFAGAVPHTLVPDHLNAFDIFAAASRIESFGVAVIEASACGLPVVVSDVGGLPEVVAHGETGLVCERENPNALALALSRLVDHPQLRCQMGQVGRQRVMELYDWPRCIDKMLQAYETLKVQDQRKVLQ